MDAKENLELRLAEQYAEIVRLVGNLTHELKNPLSTIRLNVELLAEELRESNSLRHSRALKKIERVQEECERLQKILDNFLSFARAHRLNLQPSDFSGEVARILELYHPKAREAGIEIIDFLAPDLPTVLLDRDNFRSALLNLILNAEQAMPSGGQLVVRTYGTPDGVALDLIDTGCGMDEETRTKVFGAFFSTKPGGSGLGLPIAQRIIEAHGGQISLQSELGRGTQVTITLPVPPRLPADGAPPTLSSDKIAIK